MATFKTNGKGDQPDSPEVQVAILSEEALSNLPGPSNLQVTREGSCTFGRFDGAWRIAGGRRPAGLLTT